MPEKENIIQVSETAKRQYISEFALNMFGDASFLLQQDDLHKIYENPTFKKNPCHIYMILRRPRIGIEPNGILITDDHISGRFFCAKR
jgi:hypothetical protein